MWLFYVIVVGKYCNQKERIEEKYVKFNLMIAAVTVFSGRMITLAQVWQFTIYTA